MQQKIKIGFKHCGNCNPQIRTNTLQSAIKELLESNEKVEIVSKDDPNINILIVLNGCPVDCAERPVGNFTEIVVNNDPVNNNNFDLTFVLEAISQKVQV